MINLLLVCLRLLAEALGEKCQVGTILGFAWPTLASLCRREADVENAEKFSTSGNWTSSHCLWQYVVCFAVSARAYEET